MGDWREQRKKNYVPVEMRHEKALQFVERERHEGGGYDRLMTMARIFIDNDEIMSVQYAIQDIKYNIVRYEGYSASEAKSMFKYAMSSPATIARELLKDVPELEGHIRLRECEISKYYPEYAHLEHPLVVNQEEGGDEAAQNV